MSITGLPNRNKRWVYCARRLSQRRYFCIIITLCLIIFLYFEININIQGSYFWRHIGRCRNSREDEESLRYLIYTSHKVLNKMKIPHFLVYGSLWGALRYNDPLPWDYDFDFGILYDDLQKASVNQLEYEFARRGINLYYQSYAGNYKVEKGNMRGDLMIFRDYYNDGMMRRIGFESWLLFIHYRYYHQFPKELIQKPLPTMKFTGLKFYVPRGGIEIQKYFYPHNWWIEVKPPGCFLNRTKYRKLS